MFFTEIFKIVDVPIPFPHTHNIPIIVKSPIDLISGKIDVYSCRSILCSIYAAYAATGIPSIWPIIFRINVMPSQTVA